MRPIPAKSLGLSNRKPYFWLLCVLVSGGLLAIVFRRVDLAHLGECLRRIHTGWWLAAYGIFGFACALGAVRWQLMLKLKNVPIAYGACLKATLAGHFCNTLLFGPAGGDLAKSFLFARWHRLSVPEILAASWLDRLAAGVGSLVFALGVLSLVEPSSWPRLTWKIPAHYLAVFLVFGAVLLTLGVWARRSKKKKSALVRPLYSLRTGLKQLGYEPKVAFYGVLLGCIVQILLSSVLMFNLWAITQLDLSWTRLFWTFPVISLLTALPISVAGLGIRESSAVLLLGWFGVPAAEAVAASLLALVCSLCWAAAGAGVLLSNEKRFLANFPNKSLE